MIIRFTFLALCVLSLGCATGKRDETLQANSNSETPFARSENIKKSVPERPFPKDSLYKLLLAEFALRRNFYPIALSSYLEEARILRDPNLSAHTTRIASFLRKKTAAKESAQLWVELSPTDPRANLTLGELLIASGELIDAIPHLAAAATAGKEVNFPELLKQYEKLTSSEQIVLQHKLKELTLKLPENINLLLTVAILNQSNGKNKEAIALLKRILNLNPNHQRSILLKSSIQLEEGSPNALSDIRQAIKLNPKDSKLRLEYAKLLTRKDLAESRRQFEILSAESPKNSELLLSLALINQEIGDIFAAKAYLQKLIVKQQKVNEARILLARISESENDLQKALIHYSLVEDGPEFLFATNRIGEILLNANQLSNFSNHFNRARSRQTHLGEELFLLEANLLSKDGFFHDSLGVFSRGIALYPNSLNLRYNRSIVAESINNLKLAEQDLRLIIASHPNNAAALNALGYTLANKTNRLVEAYELISKALELKPNEPAILDSMGWILYKQQRYEKALEFLRKAYDLLPDPEVAAHIGEVLWITGKTQAAKEIWEEADKISPGHKVLKETLKRFKANEFQLKS